MGLKIGSRGIGRHGVPNFHIFDVKGLEEQSSLDQTREGYPVTNPWIPVCPSLLEEVSQDRRHRGRLPTCGYFRRHLRIPEDVVGGPVVSPTPRTLSFHVRDPTRH